MANFTGQNFESVKAELEEKYKQVTVNYIENDKPKGEIVEQIPTPDQMVIEAEQELKIWVSKGPYQIRPGDFSGWTENSVTGYLNERKLTSDIKRVFRYSRKRTCNFAISKTRYTIKREIK